METMEAILELRKKLNISQDEFARRLSVTRQAVSRWENGDTIPNICLLYTSRIWPYPPYHFLHKNGENEGRSDHRSFP